MGPLHITPTLQQCRIQTGVFKALSCDFSVIVYERGSLSVRRSVRQLGVLEL